MPSHVPLEREEAATLVAWLRLRGLPFHHSPNETGSDPYARRRAVRMKREGTSPGFPDYTVVTKSGVIYIELKRTKGSSTSPEQRAWIEALNQAGSPAYIARGAEEAIDIISKHMKPWSSPF
jgi:hypothetical protein